LSSALPLSISRASSWDILFKLSSIARYMEQVGGSWSTLFHTSTNVWLCLSVFTAPAMYAAGAVVTADVRDAPPNAHDACRCSSHLSPSLEVIPHSVWAIFITD